MQADFSAVTKHCRGDACCEQWPGPMQSTLQGDTCLSPETLQVGPTTGQVRSSHVLQQYLIIILSLLLVLVEQSGKT